MKYLTYFRKEGLSTIVEQIFDAPLNVINVIQNT